jgi:hypothetical protein
MADFTIPDLTAGVAVTATDLFEAYQGAAPSVKVTAAQLKTNVLGNVVLTNPASAATLTLTAAKILTITNTLTFSGTDSTVITFPTTSATVARTDAANTFAGVQTFSGAIKVSGDTTGAGTTVGFGTNSPAITLSGPFTWIKFTSSDGSTVYVPAYK